MKVSLIGFETARIFSELAEDEVKNFKQVRLTLCEKLAYNSYLKKGIRNLTIKELIEFQKLYCKEEIEYAINHGKFEVYLQFSTQLADEVKTWLRDHGYYLTVYQPEHFDYDSTMQLIPPLQTTDYINEFILRW